MLATDAGFALANVYTLKGCAARANENDQLLVKALQLYNCIGSSHYSDEFVANKSDIQSECLLIAKEIKSRNTKMSYASECSTMVSRHS